MTEGPWFAKLRAAYKPDRVRLLLIGESAPDPGGEDQRFFYNTPLTQHDNLYRRVVEALYCEKPGRKGDSKVPWLERLKADGVFLIDLCPCPVNHLESGRARARRENVPQCAKNARDLGPEGVIVCHAPTFEDLAPTLREEGLALLHDQALPFPSGNYRQEFITGVRAALRPTKVPLGPCD